MSEEAKRKVTGRGSSLEILNRFDHISVTDDWEQLTAEDQAARASLKIKTEYYDDLSASIISENSSPDIDFNFSLNPYRGCEHGCSYCYARPTHEYLGFNAGIDFESKIMVKRNAAELFRKWLSRPKWKACVEPIMLSGVTDCYQGCEGQFQLTRQCLEVALEFRQPIRITTKNGLVRRDLDLLAELAKRNLVCVSISVSSLDQSLIRKMEPRSSAPQARLDTIAELSAAGVPVKALVAPVIPGLNDDEIPTILKSVATAGARLAGYTVLRLPLSVEPVFLDWLRNTFPDRYEKIVGRIKSLRGGKMYDADFSSRMKGQGIWAEQIRLLFNTIAKQAGLQRGMLELERSLFCLSDNNGRQQLELF